MKSIPELLAEYETRLLKDRLLEYPEMIKNQKSKIRRLKDAFREADRERVILEADIAGEIASETNPNTGKAAYGNAEARSVELTRRKKTDTGYQDVAKVARDAEYELGEAQDELEALQDKFKAYRYVVRLTAEELALMATEEQEEAIEGVPVSKQPY